MRSTAPLAMPKYLASGMTLIEMLVAITLGLLIVLAASATLLISKRSFQTVDAGSQLQDNARFAIHLIQRLAVQAGYQDVVFAATRLRREAGIQPDPPLGVSGFNNALPDFTSLETSKPRPTHAVGQGSDVLVLRNQQSALFPGSPDADGSMIDCLGAPGSSSAPQTRDEVITSILYVNLSDDGEPALMCARSKNGQPPYSERQPLIQGVENFQVLYGVDGDSPPDSVPERFLRADQMVVQGDSAATHANWRRTRSLRIGMILRGEPGTAQTPDSRTIYPFGTGRDANSPANAFASTDDPGTIVKPANDTRLRQVVNFTVHLRNSQAP